MSHLRILPKKLFRNIGQLREYSECIQPKECREGLVLGVFEDCCGELKLTSAGNKVDQESQGKLKEMLKGVSVKLGQVYLLNNPNHPKFTSIAVAGLGLENVGYNLCENLDEAKENTRIAAGAGARALQKLHMDKIHVESMHSAESAAEGASLSIWKYQDFKNPNERSVESCLEFFGEGDKNCFENGLKKGEAQNLARRLEEIPPNVMTPREFSQQAIDNLCPLGISVEVKDMEWIKAYKMNAFATIAQTSCNKPAFIQLSYCGGNPDDKPVVIVGKGVTFDSGGIMLRKCKDMMEYKGDMAGAAVSVGTFYALARLGIPINAIALLPMTENMPGSSSVRPGDVMMGVSEKTIRLDNPRKESRVILSDVLSYSICYQPCILFNVATLADESRHSLGSSASLVFTNNEALWSEVNKAGAVTGDRVWRFPLWKYFKNRVTNNESVDTVNIGKMRGGEPCIGAAFLAEFIPQVAFLHMDITATGMVAGPGFTYLAEGAMTGRPVRTLTQALDQLACPDKKPCGQKET